MTYRAPLARVVSLHVYPVKGCGGFQVESVELDRFGIEGDRRFLVVDGAGKFITQRSHPSLALVAARYEAGNLLLEAAHAPVLRVPRQAASTPQLRSVTVWANSDLQAEDCGPESSRWWSEYLQQEAHLVRIGAAYTRPVKPGRAHPGDEVSFADAYPLLLLSLASLRTLNDRLQEKGEAPVGLDRFRPNIVVDDCAPHAEDQWTHFRIGSIPLRAAGACARCVVTTTDQTTGQRSPEPLRTMATYRRDSLKPSEVNFGQNVIHVDKKGRLKTGDLAYPIE